MMTHTDNQTSLTSVRREIDALVDRMMTPVVMASMGIMESDIAQASSCGLREHSSQGDLR